MQERAKRCRNALTHSNIVCEPMIVCSRTASKAVLDVVAAVGRMMSQEDGTVHAKCNVSERRTEKVAVRDMEGHK